MKPNKDMTAEYIDSHECIYSYLIRYFLPELSDPYFRQDASHEIEQDERMTYCRYMAAWLPHEPHYNQILYKLKQLCESDRKAVKHIWNCIQDLEEDSKK